MNRNTLAAAFPATVPVLMGYLAIGIAFGLMLHGAGYGVVWAFFMSLAIYAGSGQYLGVSLLAAGASLTQVAFLTLMINFRHLVYGLSMIEKFRGMGPRKFYMIFSLTDETYALLSSAKPPQGVRAHDFYFAVALLDHSYWIVGSVLGSLAGAALGVDTTGVDFAMTALFLVIAVGQWRAAGSHVPALLGGAATLVSLLVMGADDMLLPALGVIVLALTLLRPKLAVENPKGDGAEREVML
ncbi:MAG: AzlC family ABC transporter permease [Lawsonibacter sp.]